MKAIVRFHIGKKTYNVGDDVPDEVAQKYPNVVAETVVKEKVQLEAETEKMEMPFAATQKVKRKREI